MPGGRAGKGGLGFAYLAAAARVTAGTDIEAAEDVALALDRARKVAGPGGLVVVTGSIYIVGEAMRTLGVRI